VARLTEGFNHFVTSIVAPVASGWSISPGGPFTHWNAPPFHGAHPEATLTANFVEWLIYSAADLGAPLSRE
jgi:hypothetical protein